MPNRKGFFCLWCQKCPGCQKSLLTDEKKATSPDVILPQKKKKNNRKKQSFSFLRPSSGSHSNRSVLFFFPLAHVLWFIPLENLNEQDAVRYSLCATVRHRACVRWGDAYLPGCVLCATSAWAPATGRSASWTCCCSRRRVCAPSRRTASARGAASSWSRRSTWGRTSLTPPALRAKNNNNNNKKDRKWKINKYSRTKYF